MGVVLQLDAQTADIHIHDLQLSDVILAPHRVQNLFPGQRLARIVHEQLDDGVFHLCQLHPLPVLFQRTVARIQQKRRLTDLIRVSPGLFAAGPAVKGVHPGSQFRRGKGLCHIIVGPGHEACHLVHLLGPGRKHNNAHLHVAGPDAPAHLKAVHLPRQHDVQQGHLHIRVFAELLQRLFAVGGFNGLIPRAFQVDDHKTPNIGFVLQNQNLSHLLSPLVAN